MKSVKTMNIGELGAYVCSHLAKNEIYCVLSGGACVSIYSENKYLSYDLDFIDNYFVSRKKKREVMAQIGFYEEGRYFKNLLTNFFIEFPPGPLSIGEEVVKVNNTIKFSTGSLHLITPTDCVKDRLAGFYHWNDKQCFEQALMVAKSQEVDLVEIEAWSSKERSVKKFKLFLKALDV